MTLRDRVLAEQKQETEFWKRAFEEAVQAFRLGYWNHGSSDGFNCGIPAQKTPSEVPTLVEAFKKLKKEDS